MSIARKIAREQAFRASKVDVAKLLSALQGLPPQLEGVGEAIAAMQGLQGILGEMTTGVSALKARLDELEFIVSTALGPDNMAELRAAHAKQKGDVG
jgi:hypothetical protein